MAACIHVIVIDVKLEAIPARASVRLTRAPPERFRLSKESAERIREIVPSTDDSWIVEALREYRMHSGQRQWLVKWQGYAENRNTWQYWEDLGESTQADALLMHHAALPKTKDDVKDMNVHELRASLELLNHDSNGPKPFLSQR